jgi:Cu/Ag efflux pump CusA
VVQDLVEAIVLVFVVMLIFLQNIRATIIPTLVIPVALLGTFIGLWHSASRSTSSPCSAWCWRSASWWTTRSW